MSEEDDRAKYWFLIPRDPKATHVSVQIKFVDVNMTIRFEDSEQGEVDVKDLLKVVPKILAECRRERQVHMAVDEMDRDLLDLLAEGDE